MLPLNSGNFVESRLYNPRLEVTNISNISVGINTLSLGYSYRSSDNGNVASVTISGLGLSSPITQTFGYDGLNRLNSFTETGTAANQQYSYDNFGNHCVSGWVNPAYSAQTPQCGNQTGITFTNNQWAPGSGPTYDAAGNQIGVSLGPGGPRVFTYDGENRIITATIPGMSAIVYAYDGEGRRVQKTVGATVTTYVYDAQGQLTDEIGGPPNLLAGQTTYLTADALGSTRMVTNSGGTVVAGYDYAPFIEELGQGMDNRGASFLGNQYPVPSSDGTSPKFTGQIRDAETGLDFFGARYFSFAQGRFVSPDPENAGADPGDAQSWNMYGYALNNPLVYVDPSGLVTCYVDGFQTDCGTVQQMLGAGAAVQCPNNACTIATSTGFLFFRAYTSGISGYFGLNQQPIENPEGIPVDLGIDDLVYVSHIQPVSPGLTPTNPCTVAGRAPSPTQYADIGKAGSVNPFKNIANLLQFKRGGELDAQVRYGGAPSYANYAFGVYMAAAGYTIGAALNIANTYAAARSRYPVGTPIAGPLWAPTPQVNVLNIANGFNAQRTGATSHQ